MLILYIAAVAVIALILQRGSLNEGFDGISYRVAPSRRLVEPDEELEIVTELENRTRKSVPFIKMEESVPDGAEVRGSGLTLRRDNSGTRMITRTYLMPLQVLRRHIRITLPARGRYMIRGSTLSIGDFLGVKDKSQYVSVLEEIVVMPRRYPDGNALKKLMGGILGDISVNRFIFEDPVLTIGLRDYTAQDPMRMISWKHSARGNRLMVKKPDYTMEPNVTVMLNVESPKEEPGLYALTERCFSIARAVCSVFESRRIQYGFISNAYTTGAVTMWDTMRDGLGSGHFTTIMEGLGRASHGCRIPLEIMIDKLASNPGRRVYVLITPLAYEGFGKAAGRLGRLTGCPVHVISAKEVE